MKKLFAIIAVVAMSLVGMAQTNQLVWSNGRLMYGTSSDLVKCTSHKLKVGFGHIPHSVLSFLAVNLPLTLAIIGS